MWNWIERCRGWVRHWGRPDSLVIRRILAGSPIIRAEMAGRMMPGDRLPWCATAVHVELPVRRAFARTAPWDLKLQSSDGLPLVADSHRFDPVKPIQWLTFRMTISQDCQALKLLWKDEVLQSIPLQRLSREEYLSELQILEVQPFVRIGGHCYAARIFPARQQRGCHLVCRLSNCWSLLPLAIQPLELELAGQRFALPLTGQQLAAETALIASASIRLPRIAGGYPARLWWSGELLAEVTFEALEHRQWYDGLTVEGSHFLIESDTGAISRTATMARQMYSRAAPIFVLRQAIAGSVGRLRTMLVEVGSTEGPRKHRISQVLASDRCEMVPMFFERETIAQRSAFELRIQGKTVAILPLSVVPVAKINAEGQFQPPGEFTWSSAAEEELTRRMNQLGERPPN